VAAGEWSPASRSSADRREGTGSRLAGWCSLVWCTAWCPGRAMLGFRHGTGGWPTVSSPHRRSPKRGDPGPTTDHRPSDHRPPGSTALAPGERNFLT
jgi:hypothetical protein